MKKGLYTVVWDFKGGSYTNQLIATNERECFKNWLIQFVEDKFNLLTSDDLVTFKIEFDSEISTIVPIDGLINTWFAGFSIGENYLSVTIVNTNNQT